MKHYIIFFCVLLCCLTLTGQNVYNGPYDLEYHHQCATNCVLDDMNLDPSNISSDFGPRRLSNDSPYDWHQGVDFNPGAGTSDIGYRIRAIEGGTISKIGRHGNGTDPLWFIAVDGLVAGVEHDFAYEHIFPKYSGTLPVTSGGFKLVELQHPPSSPDRYGILTPDNTLLSDCNPCTGYYYVSGTTTINATNQVDLGDYLAPLGQSAAAHAHLHLNRYEAIQNGWTNHQYVNGNDLAIDPFEILGHSIAGYDVTVHRNGGNNVDLLPQGIGLVYPGTNTARLMVRPTIRGEANGSTYTNSVLDLSKVAVKIKGLHDLDYEFIEGANFRSEVMMGATMQDNTQYPASLHTQIGSWNTSGMRPYAYRDAGARPWDDYFLSDFVSRIHKDDQMTGTVKIAHCPQNARYNDGPYELKARATDVRGGYYEGPRNNTGALTPVEFNLDNFKPFVEGVNVKIDQTEIYDMHWEYTNSCEGIRPIGGIISSELQLEDLMNGTMWVQVRCSEPMSSLVLEVWINGEEVDPAQYIAPEFILNEGLIRNFSVHLPSSIFDSSSSNPDIQLVFGGTDYPVDVNGLNPNHLLNLSDYFSPDDSSLNTNCVKIPTRENALDNPNSWSSILPEGFELAHHFTIQCLSDGNVIENDPSKSAIKMFNGSCCTDEILEELTDGITLVGNEKCLCSDEPVQAFSLDVNPSNGPYTYIWNGPEGYYSTEQNPINISLPGTYNVKVTTEDGCRVELDVTIKACIPLEEPYITAAPICDESGLGKVELNINHTLGYSFQWQNGPISPNPYLENVPPGEYTVVVSDGEGCQIILSTELLDGYDETFSSTLESEMDCICQVDHLQQAFTLSVEGLNTPFNFNWTGPNGFSSGEQSPLISHPGNYAVTITGASGCELIEEINIPSCTEGFQASTIAVPTCTGEANGQASIVATGPGVPFAYLWSTGQTQQHITNLAAGIYQVTVTDRFACQLVETVIISNIQPIEITNSPIIIDCFGQGTASITPEVIGGDGTYTYSWSTGESGLNPTIDGLSAGAYTVTITRTNQQQCSEVFHFVVSSSGTLPAITETITDATCEKPGSISLLVEPEENYSIQWSDGVTDELERTDLTVGSYSVTLTDSYGCSINETYVIENLHDQPGYWNGINLVSTTESATQASCDGTIEFELNGDFGPYDIAIFNPDGIALNWFLDVTGIVTFTDLCPTENKFYEIRVRDVNGCRDEFFVPISVCSLPITLESYIRPSDTEDDGGSISVSVPSEYDNVEFEWSNGETSNSIDHLPSGIYTVTATDATGCTGVNTFEIKDCITYIYEYIEEEGDWLVVDQELNYEEFEIEIVGGLFPENSATSEVSILIKEEGQTSFLPIDLSEYHIDWFIGNNLIGSDESPFTVPAPPHISTFLKAIVYKDNCFSVEATKRLLACGQDLGGNEDWLLPEIFITDIEHPCGGLGNGQFTIEVPAVGFSIIDITVNGQTQSYSSLEGLDAVNQSFLSMEPGIFDITITLNENCSFSFPFTLQDQPAERVFVDIDMDSETCFYDLVCDDVALGTLEESSVRLYGEGQDFPCGLPLRCDDFVTDSDLHLDRLIMRGVEAVNFINTLGASGVGIYSTTDISNALSTIMSGSNWPCRKVKICPANLNVSFHGFNGFYGGSTLDPNTGCNLITCNGVFGNDQSYVTCPQSTNQTIADVYSGIISPSDPIFSCTVVTENFGFLRDQIISAISNNPFDNPWANSDLSALALQYETDSRAYCARVSYCLEDFSVLTINIEDIFCNFLGNNQVYDVDGNEITQSCEPFVIDYQGSEELAVLCTNGYGDLNGDGTPDGFYIWLPFAGSTEGLVGGVQFESPQMHLDKIKAINTGEADELLTGLAYHKIGEAVVPKGIIKSPTGNAYYDFDHDVSYVNKFPTGNEIIHLIDDWGTGQTVDVSRTSSTEYMLTYQSSTVFWSKPIHSNGQNIEINDLFFEDGKITLIASAAGDIYFDDQSFSNVNQASYNIITIDPQSSGVLDAKICHGISASDTKVVHNGGKLSILAKNSNGGITINGQGLYPTAAHEWVSLSMLSSTDDLTEKARVSSAEDFDILAYTVAPASAKDAMVLKQAEGVYPGNGVISIQNTLNNGFANLTTNSNNQYAQICARNTNGSLAWQSGIQQMPDSKIFETLIEYDDEGLLYTVITFSGSIIFQGHTYTSLGGKDVVVLKISTSGQLISDHQYGSVDDEEVSEIFSAQGGLYLGGVFSGATLSRQLGDYEIINQTNDVTSKVFVTFLSGDKTQDLLNQNNTEDEFWETILEKENGINNLIAYPNPFKNSFRLEFNATLNDVARIKVLDVLGRSIFEFDEVVEVGFNEFEINLTEVSSSQLLNIVIEFKSGQQSSLQTRLIRE